MKQTHVIPNFIYPEIPETQYMFGASPVVSVILREDGDWRDYLPPEETQNKRGIESSACYIEAQQHTIATIEEESFGEIDNNYASRFNALLSNGTPFGGDPIAGAESIRKDGLVKENSMPFDDGISSWDDFHSWKGVNEDKVKEEGKNYLTKKKPNHEIVFLRENSIKKKYANLRKALKRAPCPLSVSAWYEENGIYVKPKGMKDRHLVECVYLDDQDRPYVRDTYPPFLKILEPRYNSDFCMLWTVKKKEIETKKRYWFTEIVMNIYKFIFNK